MIFVDTFTVPAGTVATAKLTRVLQIAHGIIHLVEVTYLDGPEDEVNIVVRRADRQVVPTTPGASIVGNNITVRALLFEPREEPPYQVEIEAWSPNASYNHEVTVRVHVLPREILTPPIPELGVLNRIKALLFGGS